MSHYEDAENDVSRIIKIAGKETVLKTASKDIPEDGRHRQRKYKNLHNDVFENMVPLGAGRSARFDTRDEAMHVRASLHGLSCPPATRKRARTRQRQLAWPYRLIIRLEPDDLNNKDGPCLLSWWIRSREDE